MTSSIAGPHRDLTPAGQAIHEHYRGLLRTRRSYSVLAVGTIAVFLVGALWFANAANAGKFLDRLPYFFDFFIHFVPNDPLEIFRAMFDLPSPYADGSQKYDYPEGRFYLTESFYLPEYFYELLITVNIAVLATLTGAGIAFVLCFFAATNLVGAGPVRFVFRRTFELLRAFPEIVIAGLLVAIFSIGPIGAIVAIAVHTVGALGKLFYEVVENADMKPDEGLRAVGGSWLERVRYGMVPQVMPNFVSYALLRTEINVRASTIIGAVGGGGIGETFRRSLSNDHPAKTYAIIILLFLTILAIDWLSGHLRRKLVGQAAFQFGG
ncbi:MAG TPA: phosphonate ABC transporter, permease protein PhnE [Devosia sp.]|jgi:phosphonate transport system permease protein|uniref:phosphonate ABC transporter, permease protein PhnE n=1 Tax=Devosia sp. TaxID=1871048 RepID=UPI002DDD308A|nr:phosphonate ABC transporter, permease protein PhnE [Devosia sp.]HEV2518883.1 phosphonate ABC transporter, permease protein PhnE [Devosia sp.]